MYRTWKCLALTAWTAFAALAACNSGSSGGPDATALTLSISGMVLGAPAAGVTVSLSGPVAASTVTDAGGNFAFDGLLPGDYLVTPSRTGYVFAPASTPMTVSGASIPGVSFAANPVVQLVITVDVEALRHRQSADHVERLIFGRFDGHEVGIEEMMRIADRAGAKLTFFVDYCEVDLHGVDQIRRVADAISGRGHDLQIHCHPTLLNDQFWIANGLSPPLVEQDEYTLEEARALIRFAVATSEAFGNPAPAAYRGGGFRYNPAILQALKEHGVPASFNYAWRLPSQRGNTTDLPTFAWSNLVFELPLAVTVDASGNRSTLDIAALKNAAAVSEAHRVIRQIAEQHGPDHVVVMLGHSWSLLDLDPATNHFYYRDDARRDAFERFLMNLPAGVQVITASEAVRRIQDGEMSVAIVRDVSTANR